MNLLLLNTCTAEALVALSSGVSVTLPARATTEQLIPAIATLVKSSRPDAIAVVSGPGSFTGIRAGLAAAKGLCEAWGIPLLAISRLELLADALKSDAEVVALLDAGRGEYYCGVYTAQGGSAQGGRARSKIREELLRFDEVQPLLATRPGVTSEERVAATFTGQITLVEEPGAEAILRIAHDRIVHQNFSDAALTDANYLRRTDAELLEKLASHSK